MNSLRQNVIARLRDGNDTQITGRLRSCDGFCITGIIADVAMQMYPDRVQILGWSWKEQNAIDNDYALSELGSIDWRRALPNSLETLWNHSIGTSKLTVHVLMQLNDAGADFCTIADWLAQEEQNETALYPYIETYYPNIL